MRRPLLLALGLLAALPCSGAAACARGGETILAAGPQAVLIRSGDDLRTTFVACDPATGARHLVGEGYGDGVFVSENLVGQAAVSGPFLAWTEVDMVKGVGGETVVTHDVRTPGVIERHPAFFDDRVTDLAVGPSGRVAARTSTGVFVLVADGARVVDRAPPWRIRRLRVEADRVVWRHEGTVRAAPLDPPVPPLRAVERDGVVRVVDTATGAPVGPPVRRLGLGWQLAADGTVVVRHPRRFLAHRRDGTVDVFAPVPRAVHHWIYDDQEGDITWWGGDRPRGRVLLVGAGCVREGERVIARSPGVVVVRRDGPHVRTATACLLSSGSRTRIARLSIAGGTGTGVGPVAIAGTTIAWGRVWHERGTQWHSLMVRDLVRPGSQRRYYAGGRIRSIAVDATGRVAALTGVTVRAADADGGRLLDAAVPGALRDLALADGAVTWTHGGQPRRASLPLPATCARPPGLVLGEQSGSAVVGTRRIAAGGTTRAIPMACRFAGGGWWAVAPEGYPRLAGSYVAVERPAGDGSEIQVHELETGEAVGAPVPVEQTYFAWTLAADGTLVVQSADAVTAHRLDGSTAVVHEGSSYFGFLGVDDVARAVTYESDSASGAALPLP